MSRAALGRSGAPVHASEVREDAAGSTFTACGALVATGIGFQPVAEWERRWMAGLRWFATNGRAVRVVRERNATRTPSRVTCKHCLRARGPHGPSQSPRVEEPGAALAAGLATVEGGAR
jgi:hypothetical protein